MDIEPTILVKKADGTFIHVPLSQLGKKKAPVPATAPVVKVVPSPANSPLGRGRGGLANVIEPTPALRPPPPGGESVVTPDLTSPLDEPAPTMHPAMPLLSQGRESQVESIVKSLSFKVPVENGNRLRTIIQLFLKDIRGERETLEVLTRRELDGGVGLSASQAEEVINKAEETNNSAITPPVIPKFDPKENMRLEKEVPAVIKKFPVVAMPKTTVIPRIPRLGGVGLKAGGGLGIDWQTASNVGQPTPTPPKRGLEPTGQTMKPAMATMPQPEFKINSTQTKTTMTDVKPVSFGGTPVDEIRNFSLTDFRRIAASPADAAARLRQKFTNLKDESIILFFQALEAWRGSSLYREYLAAVAESLAKRTPLTKAVDKQKIQLTEIAALVEMEKDF